MATRLNGLKSTDAITPGAEWRCVLVVDPLEPFLISSFDGMVTRWLEGINGRGLAFQSSPVTREGGIGAKLVAVVDIKIIPLAVDQGTVNSVVSQLDDMVPGIDVREIWLVPPGESNVVGEFNRNALLQGAKPGGVLSSAGDRIADAARGAADTFGGTLKPLQDILILALALLVVYFVLRGRAVTA